MKLRSLLFVPGDSEKKLHKCESVGADVLILDLEDSVAPQRKSAARGLVREFLADRAGHSSRRLWVRINPLERPGARADLEAVLSGSPEGIVLPKAASLEDVLRLGGHLDTLETEQGIETGSTRILPLTAETPAAVLSLAGFARGAPRLAALAWGSEDLGTALGVTASRDPAGAWTPPFALARSLCLFAARAAGVAAIDTVYTDYRDPAGLRAACGVARRDGFDGKLAIHPDQVAPINAAFTPGRDEVERARRIVELFDANPGEAVLSLDGVMLDIPHLKRARMVLEAAGAEEDERPLA